MPNFTAEEREANHARLLEKHEEAQARKASKRRRVAEGLVLYQGREVPAHQAFVEYGRQGGLASAHARVYGQGAAQAGDQPIFYEFFSRPVFDCNGCQTFNCVTEIAWKDFLNVDKVTILQWLKNHVLIDARCKVANCPGLCDVVSADPTLRDVYLRCPNCGTRKRKIDPLNLKLSPLSNLVLLYVIIQGHTAKICHRETGISKKSFRTMVGNLQSLFEEQHRRDRLVHSYQIFQVDEALFGKAKYHRGRIPRRKGQWVLSLLEVSAYGPGQPVTSLHCDVRFTPRNKRNAPALQPLVEDRAIPGRSVMVRNRWRAYPVIARNLNLHHYTVNHSMNFVDPITGIHTQNVEGLHRIIKKQSMDQFNRLPIKTRAGKTKYLDIIVWRINTSFEASRNNQPVNLFQSLCKVLRDRAERLYI